MMIRNLLAIAVPVLSLILFSGTVTTAEEPARRLSSEEIQRELERRREELRERHREHLEELRRDRDPRFHRDEFAPSPLAPGYHPEVIPTPERNSISPPLHRNQLAVPVDGSSEPPRNSKGGTIPSPYLPEHSRERVRERQIRHLRMASENLAAAGFKEEADKLKQRADAIEQRHNMPFDEDRLFQELKVLQMSVDGLRKEVAELRRQLASRRGELQPIPPTYSPRPTSGHIESEGEKPSVRPTMNHPKPSISEKGAAPGSLIPATIPSAKLDEPVRDPYLGVPGESKIAPGETGDFELVPVPDSKKSESKPQKNKTSNETIPTIPQPYLEKDSNK